MTMFEEAKAYWETNERMVYEVAIKNDLDNALDWAIETDRLDFSQLVFDLFDYGEYEPTEKEILDALIEATK